MGAYGCLLRSTEAYTSIDSPCPSYAFIIPAGPPLNPPHLLGPLEKPLQPAFSIFCRASFGRRPASQVTLWSDHSGRKRRDQIKTCVSGESCQLAPGSHKVFPAGIMAVAITPSQQLAAVISSAFYSLWNLFSGFLIPRPVSSVNPALQDAQSS
jgi:hypothetical protein